MFANEPSLSAYFLEVLYKLWWPEYFIDERGLTFMLTLGFLRPFHDYFSAPPIRNLLATCLSMRIFIRKTQRYRAMAVNILHFLILQIVQFRPLAVFPVPAASIKPIFTNSDRRERKPDGEAFGHFCNALRSSYLVNLCQSCSSVCGP